MNFVGLICNNYITMHGVENIYKKIFKFHDSEQNQILKICLRVVSFARFSA